MKFKIENPFSKVQREQIQSCHPFNLFQNFPFSTKKFQS